VTISRVLLATAALALFTLPAAADIDSLTVRDNTGAIVSQVSVDDSVADPTAFNFDVATAAWIDPSQFGNATTLYSPAGDPVNGPFTDIFGIASTDSGLVLAFTTGGGTPEGPEAYGTAFGPILEDTGDQTGLPASYDATYNLDPGLQAAGWTATFTESPNGPVVPEPASLTLLGLGAMGLGIQSWQKRRKLLLQLA
jgi:hypothetical protein